MSPGALAGATALEHEAFSAAARRFHGDTAGTRELVEVLLSHRHLPHRDVAQDCPSPDESDRWRAQR